MRQSAKAIQALAWLASQLFSPHIMQHFGVACWWWCTTDAHAAIKQLGIEAFLVHLPNHQPQHCPRLLSHSCKL